MLLSGINHVVGEQGQEVEDEHSKQVTFGDWPKFVFHYLPLVDEPVEEVQDQLEQKNHVAYHIRPDEFGCVDLEGEHERDYYYLV